MEWAWLPYRLLKVRFSCWVSVHFGLIGYHKSALGAKVIAAAGSDVKLEVSRQYGGADYAIDYSKPDWQKQVLKITGGKGVDVIYDPVGLIRGAYTPASLVSHAEELVARFFEVYCMERKSRRRRVRQWPN